MQLFTFRHFGLYLRHFHFFYLLEALWVQESYIFNLFYSGKTYTMVGTRKDPGLMVLSLHTIFDLIKKDKSSDIFEVSCSYLEVYNEVWFCSSMALLLNYYSSCLWYCIRSHKKNFPSPCDFRSFMICLKNHQDTWSLEKTLSMALWLLV